MQMQTNQGLDFWNNVDGVDTLCGTISSLNLINSNPVLRTQLLEKKKMPQEYQDFQGILEATQTLLKKSKPSQIDFEEYVRQVSKVITDLLNKQNFKGTIKPDGNGDFITKIKKPNIPLIDGLLISEKNNQFYPYDNFIYRLFNRANVINTYANKTSYFNKNEIATAFSKILPKNKQDKENITNINSSQLSNIINQLVSQQFKTSKRIPLNVKVIYDHDKGGHLVTFVRNKQGTFDLIGAYNNPKDVNKEEKISVRYIEITACPAFIMELYTNHPFLSRKSSQPYFSKITNSYNKQIRRIKSAPNIYGNIHNKYHLR